MAPTCDVCRRPLTGKPASARFCSSACRQHAYRNRKADREERPAVALGQIQAPLAKARRGVMDAVNLATSTGWHRTSRGSAQDLARDFLVLADRLVAAAEGVSPGVTKDHKAVTVPERRIRPVDLSHWQQLAYQFALADGARVEGRTDQDRADWLRRRATEILELADSITPPPEA